MSVPTECAVTSRIVFSIIGVFVGVSVFFAFGFSFHNWNVALWGLVSGFAASFSIYVHVGYRKKIFEAYPYRLQNFMLTGCFIQLIGCCGFVAYLVLAITQHQGLIIYGNGYYLVLIYNFLTWKWGFFLLYYSRKYKRLYISEYMSLVSEKDHSTTNKHQIEDGHINYKM